MDQWLVRTSKNHLTGPFSKAEVCQMIHASRIGFQDEVCQANQYWFLLSESEEVYKQLGIRMPLGHQKKEEETLTENMEDQEEFLVHEGPEKNPPFDSPAALEEEEMIYDVDGSEPSSDSEGADIEPHMPELAEESEENTAVLSNRALRQFRQGGNKPSEVGAGGSYTPSDSAAKLFEPQVLGDSLRTSRKNFWIGFIFIIFLLMGAVGFLTYKGILPVPSFDLPKF